MPYIKKDVLDALYQEVDSVLAKLRTCQEQYEILKKKKTPSKNNNNLMNTLFWILLFLFIMFVWFAYDSPELVGIHQKSKLPQIQSAHNNIEKPNDHLENDFQGYETPVSVLEDQTIYSVQIGAFKKFNLSLFSKNLINFKNYNYKDYHAYALGNFDNFDEALSFRKALMDLGFQDAFVTTYVNGKRKLIENPTD